VVGAAAGSAREGVPARELGREVGRELEREAGRDTPGVGFAEPTRLGDAGREKRGRDTPPPLDSSPPFGVGFAREGEGGRELGREVGRMLGARLGEAGREVGRLLVARLGEGCRELSQELATEPGRDVAAQVEFKGKVRKQLILF